MVDQAHLSRVATLRSLLSDFTFEFVEGTEPHLEGSWSQHYHSSPNDKSTPLYSYCKAFNLQSTLETELNLLDLLLEEDPPFDGVLAYSSGAALAAQVFLRHERERGPDSQPLFKFAIFCNAVMPGRVFTLEESVGADTSTDRTLIEEALQYVDIISGFRIKAMPELEAQMKARRVKDRAHLEIDWKSMKLPDGAPFLTDGKYCVAAVDCAVLPISIPTLHIVDLQEPRLLGSGMLELCDRRIAREYHHSHGHEFPRGYRSVYSAHFLLFFSFLFFF